VFNHMVRREPQGSVKYGQVQVSGDSAAALYFEFFTFIFSSLS
jgi:hypothetical protein